MKEKLLAKTTGTCVIIFLILIVVHSFEAIILSLLGKRISLRSQMSPINR